MNVHIKLKIVMIYININVNVNIILKNDVEIKLAKQLMKDSRIVR